MELLQNFITPVKYTIKIEPNFKTFNYNGVVIFDFHLYKSTYQIILNSKELNVKSCYLFSNNNNYFIPKKASILYDKKKEYVIFNFNKKIQGGNYYLIINYSGIHNDDMAGFYRSEYIDSKTNEKKYLMVTQFEAVDARRAFPCMDEPSKKAKFQLMLVIPLHLTALSNTNIENIKLSNNKKEITFKKTPIMSTYLLAFIVGEIEYIEKICKLESGKHVRCRIYTLPGQKEDGLFALELCVKVLKYYSEFFEIDYVLDKLDMIAIPDFAAGAMENWGLITYRTKTLLYNKNTTSIQTKIRIAYVICHELAHQWFGNLVTMGWWSDLWLNEGFATWVGWMAVNNFFPEWKIWETFYKEEIMVGLDLDTLINTHPIYVPINRAQEVDEIFDAISYSKGACIIGMLVNIMGIDNFRLGIIEYLHKFKFKNASSFDLWIILGSYTDIAISKLIIPWIHEKGYPLLTIKYENKELKISKTIFNNNINNINVPINFIINNKENYTELVDSMIIKINKINNINMNTKATGFYRVLYDDNLLKIIGTNIRLNKLNVIDRANILNDLFYETIYGYFSLEDLINFMMYYKNEDEYLVWYVIFDICNYIKKAFYSKNINKLINMKLIELVPVKLNELKVEIKNKDYNKIQLHKILLEIAVDLNIYEVITQCFKLLIENISNGVLLDKNLESIIYKAVIYNDKLSFDTLLNMYIKCDNEDKKLTLLKTFGYNLDGRNITKVLNICFYENLIRKQDIHYVLNSISKNIYVNYNLVNYIMDNWQAISNKLSGGLLGKVIISGYNSIINNKLLTKYNNFITKLELDYLNKTIEQAKEKALVRIMFNINNNIKN
jgi:aminopeptidase N